ncbi:MAG: choice-of-anchor Q domain-containing protein [Rhodanobacteraceae bacterium]
MHSPAFLRVFACMTLLIAQAAGATTFCVSTSGELQDALTEAGSNGADDVIRIKTGTYDIAIPFVPVAFTYETSQNFDVTLQGGWVGNGDACSRRFSNPAATVLSGSGSRAVLWMIGANGSRGDMIVQQLTIRDGNSSDYGAGLRIGGHSGTNGFDGDLIVERVYFDNNNSDAWAAGLDVETGGGVRVRDNVFRSNSCSTNACAGEFFAYSDDAVEVRQTFGNNTLVGNVCNDDATPSCITGGFLINGWIDAMPHTSVHNNLFALNDGNDLQLIGGSHVDVMYNNINQMIGIPESDFGNLHIINPHFVSLLDDNFRLLGDSPMRNAGGNGFPYGEDDFDGAARVQEGQVDIGAFEFGDGIFTDGFE